MEAKARYGDELDVVGSFAFYCFGDCSLTRVRPASCRTVSWPVFDLLVWSSKNVKHAESRLALGRFTFCLKMKRYITLFARNVSKYDQGSIIESTLMLQCSSILQNI